MTPPKIPIENIYYLFCYAWDCFEEARAISTGAEASPDLPNLLARVLIAGTRSVLRRGLDRGYQSYSNDIPTVRGRIELAGTLRLRALHSPRLQCSFDELSHDTVPNRMLKASLRRLSNAPSLEPSLAHELRELVIRLADVSDVRLDRAAFARIQLHRNNGYYHLLLKVAELAFDSLLPHPSGEGFRFVDVLRDDAKMARVFEEFVRNFYRTTQKTFSVGRLEIAWDAVPMSSTGAGRLPKMRTDVYLRSAERRVIIDTKYHADTLQTYQGSASFKSANLYQIFAYVKNAAADRLCAGIEGLLIYPQVGALIDASYRIQGHPIRIATIDLTRPWQHIEARLLDLINLPTVPKQGS
jgi:5-methylcytosine-specific restriction enzyme subunit McrC